MQLCRKPQRISSFEVKRLQKKIRKSEQTWWQRLMKSKWLVGICLYVCTQWPQQRCWSSLKYILHPPPTHPQSNDQYDVCFCMLQAKSKIVKRTFIIWSYYQNRLVCSLTFFLYKLKYLQRLLPVLNWIGQQKHDINIYLVWFLQTMMHPLSC